MSEKKTSLLLLESVAACPVLTDIAVHFCSNVTSVSSPLDEINLDFLCIFLEIFMFSKLTLLPLAFVCSILTPLYLEVSTAGPGLLGSYFASSNTRSECSVVATPPCR